MWGIIMKLNSVSIKSLYDALSSVHASACLALDQLNPPLCAFAWPTTLLCAFAWPTTLLCAFPWPSHPPLCAPLGLHRIVLPNLADTKGWKKRNRDLAEMIAQAGSGPALPAIPGLLRPPALVAGK